MPFVKGIHQEAVSKIQTGFLVLFARLYEGDSNARKPTLCILNGRLNARKLVHFKWGSVRIVTLAI